MKKLLKKISLLLQDDKAVPVTINKEFDVVLCEDALLKPYEVILERLYSSVPLDKKYFETHYLSAAKGLARYVQALPASEAHHHQHKGGLLQHSLEIALYATRLSRKYIYIDKHESSISELEDRFTYACFTAALFHDVGKPIMDFTIVHRESPNSEWVKWNPALGPLPINHEYQYRYLPERNYKAHPVASLPFALACLSDDSVQWLYSNRKIFSDWVLALSGQYEIAGGIGQAVSTADKFSASESIAGNSQSNEPRKITTLLEKIKVLLQNHERLNHSGNAFFVARDHILMIHPKWTDELIENAGNARSEQNRILNILGEDKRTIKASNNRTVNKLVLKMKSKTFGNINNSVLSVVLIRREALDPKKELPTCELSVKSNSDSSLPEELQYLTDSAAEEHDKTQQSPEIVRATNDNSNKEPPNKSLSTDIDTIKLSSSSDEALDVVTQNEPIGDVITSDEDGVSDHERGIFEEYFSLQDSSPAPKVNHPISTPIEEIKTQNNDDSRANSSVDAESDYDAEYSDETVTLFLSYVQGLAKDSRTCNNETALLHKVNNSIFLIWPEVCSKFWSTNNSALKEKFNCNRGRNKSLERHLLKSSFYSKMAGNKAFWKIQFRAKQESVYGVPVGCIKLCKKICESETFVSVKVNSSAREYIS